MLRIEKRLFRIKLLLRHEFLKPGNVVARAVARLALGKMRKDEVISLDGLAYNGRPFLMEAVFPNSLAVVQRDDEFFHRRFIGIILHAWLAVAVGVAAAVVIAVMEQIDDRLAVAAPVVRKNLEPGVGDELQLRSRAVVGKIAANQDSVGAPLVERPQSLLPAGGVVARSYVNVA